MKKPNTLLKVAAVVSSLLLVTGLVSYQAGAFNWLLETSSPAADAARGATGEANVDPDTPHNTVFDITKHDPTFMSSSKSIVIGSLKKPGDPSGSTSQPSNGSK